MHKLRYESSGPSLEVTGKYLLSLSGYYWKSKTTVFVVLCKGNFDPVYLAGYL